MHVRLNVNYRDPPEKFIATIVVTFFIAMPINIRPKVEKNRFWQCSKCRCLEINVHKGHNAFYCLTCTSSSNLYAKCASPASRDTLSGWTSTARFSSEIDAGFTQILLVQTSPTSQFPHLLPEPAAADTVSMESKNYTTYFRELLFDQNHNTRFPNEMTLVLDHLEINISISYVLHCGVGLPLHFSLMSYSFF